VLDMLLGNAIWLCQLSLLPRYAGYDARLCEQNIKAGYASWICWQSRNAGYDGTAGNSGSAGYVDWLFFISCLAIISVYSGCICWL